jgi:hypothetical protein
LLTSSPATTVGIVHTLFQKHHGPNGSPDTIVIQADTRSLNPTIRQSVIDKAFADDAASAASEYGGMFRSPMGAFLSRELVESCVEKGVTERVPMPGIEYKAFVDVASGSGSDAFAAAVGHRVRDGNRNIVWLDQVFVKKPPFDPLSAIGELCSHLQRWRITQISGDAYAGGFTPSAFGNHGIAYIPAKLNASELYLASLPAFTSGTVKLLDLAELVEQLVNLRRKVGQAGAEQVLHQRGHHDDIANAVAGLVHLLSPIEPIAVNSGIYDWIGVISEPRTYAGSYSNAEDAAHAYLTKGSYRSSGGWP